MLEDYLRQYGLLAIFTAIAIVVPVGMLFLSWVVSLVRVRPYRPSDVKYTTYECGMETIGGRWMQFNFRYYLFALLFVVFSVETVFMYPWAVRFGKLGLFAFIEMLVFVLILLVGWVYAWRKRALEWG